MKPYATNIVTFHVLLAGYEQAVGRFDQISRIRDARQVFAPLFEALNWAAALDDQARKHYAPEGKPAIRSSAWWLAESRFCAGVFAGRCAGGYGPGSARGCGSRARCA